MLARTRTCSQGALPQCNKDGSDDDLLPSGQKIQFGATEDVAVRRPNGAYVEYRGDLGVKKFWYGGGAVILYEPRMNFYATARVPGKLDDAIHRRHGV